MYFFRYKLLLYLSTTTCSSISEKKFKLSIEVFFLVVLRRKEKIGIVDQNKWRLSTGNNAVVDNILFFLFICKQQSSILLYYRHEKDRKVLILLGL